MDFETTQQYDLVLLVTNKRGEVTRVPFRVDVADVSELSASHTVRKNAFHEGTTQVGSIVADVLPVADETPTYELTGAGSEYFRINNNGKIKVDQPLDFSAFQTIELQVVITSGTESTTETVVINVQENLSPDFTHTLSNANGVFSEGAALGTSILNVTRTDTDSDDLVYSLENDFSGTFAIDSTTGEVSLSNSLDFETTSSYNLKVIATDSKGLTKEIIEPLQVGDVVISFNGDQTDPNDTYSEGTALGHVIIDSFTSNFSNVTYSLLQDNDSKFAINPSTGQVTLASNFDFETSQSHSFTVQASAPNEAPETLVFDVFISDLSVDFQIRNTNNADITDLGSLSFGEFLPVGTEIANVSSSEAGATFALIDPDNKFNIDANGRITLANAFDYESDATHSLQVEVTANGEPGLGRVIPIQVNNQQVSRNVISANGITLNNGYGLNNFRIGEFSPAGTVVSTANGTPGITWSLLKHDDNPLQIDPNTGTVTLASPLDFESDNTHIYQVVASFDNEPDRYTGYITFKVDDESYNSVIPYFNSTSVTNTNFVGNRMLQATNNWMRQSGTAISAWIPNNMGTKDAAGRVIADFGQGLPAGTTYALSFLDTTGWQVLTCGTGDSADSRHGCFDVDSNGVLRVAAGKTLESVNAGVFRGKTLGGLNREQQMIDKLAGHSPNGHWVRDNYANSISVAITPPNEPTTYSSINLKPVRTEAQENVVMKFSETLVKTGTFPGDRPFERGQGYYFKREASMATDTGEPVQINASQYGHGDSITESVLASHQLEGNTKLASATSKVGGGMAWIAQSNGAKTYYRTNTVANGLNENDVNILDFEYWFPVDNMQSGGYAATGTPDTKGIYAPLAVANADWDNEAHSNERAKYGCYNSGKAGLCGTGTHELSISGSMVQAPKVQDFLDIKLFKKMPLTSDRYVA